MSAYAHNRHVRFLSFLALLWWAVFLVLFAAGLYLLVDYITSKRASTAALNATQERVAALGKTEITLQAGTMRNMTAGAGANATDALPSGTNPPAAVSQTAGSSVAENPGAASPSAAHNATLPVTLSTQNSTEPIVTTAVSASNRETNATSPALASAGTGSLLPSDEEGQNGLVDGQAPIPGATTPGTSRILDPAWMPLIVKLGQDGFDVEKTTRLFAGLGPSSYSPAFMAAKILELYGVGGVGIRRSPEGDVVPPDGYSQPISDVTIGSCRAFMTKYADVLENIRKKHGVPATTIVAVLLVETGLGCDLGSDPALRALGSMALTSTPALLGSAGNSAQVKRVSAASLKNTLKEKSAWAYDEVKALIRYGEDTNRDIAQMPGSMYGAVGLCQFMPTNIVPYGVDGDGDGKVDLFSVVDAMYSVANYLEGNGWRGAKTPEQRFSVILTYNHDNYYAARVLGVSNQLDLAAKGKVASGRSALAGVGPVPPSVLDPSLKRRGRFVPPSARIKSLNSYQDLLSRE